MNKKTAVRWLCGIVIVLILACLGQDLLLTDAGAVRVERLGWVTEDGAYLNSVLFVPRSATAQTPAPAVITCHGYNNTTGDMENNNLELARRVAGAATLPHNILLVFQPAEETGGGAKPICDSGVFTQYRVEAIFGLHLWPELPLGRIASMPGGMMCRSAEVTLTVSRWAGMDDAFAPLAPAAREAFALVFPAGTEALERAFAQCGQAEA